MSSRPKTLTNPLRPVARYRKGKGPAAPASDSDSDDDNAAPPAGGSSDEDEKPNISAPPPRTGKAAGAGGKLNVALKEVEVDDKGMVTVGGRGEVGRTEKEMESEEESSGTSSFAARSCRFVADSVARSQWRRAARRTSPSPRPRTRCPPCPGLDQMR